ncbi:MAG: SDR family oxidoreductase [Acidobacteriaceae bacterium]|nr:SDR family oxidoreductase [Acidobacteriaceae bacterium]
MRTFDGRVVLITGGTSGIGRATAQAFAREGARVAIAARGVDRGHAVRDEIQHAGGECVFLPTDLSRVDQIQSLVEQTVSLYGRLDCAVNNAATEVGILKPTADFNEEEFDLAIAVNLKAVWLGMKYQISQMLRQTPVGGAIVNTSSLNGLGGARMGSIYSATKAGVLAFTKSAAQEYAANGIRVNALVAGGFHTPMLHGLLAKMSQGDPAAEQELEAQYQRMIPMNRLGDPAEAAEAVLWLCSPAASYVTGHSMIVDGGWSAPLR